jgi:hypothetical protein
MYVLLTHSIGPYLMQTNYVRSYENWSSFLTLWFSTFEWNFELLYGDKFLSFHHRKEIKLISNGWNKRFAKKIDFFTILV